MSNSNDPRRPESGGRPDGQRRRASDGQRRAQSGESPAQNGERRTPHRRTKKRPLPATLLVRLLQIIGSLILVGAVTGAILACYAAVYIKTVVIPKSHLDLSAYTLNENSVIYYKDKNTGLYVELTTLVGEKNSEWVDYEDIPEDLINAVVAIEDKRFWTHNGVDWRRTGFAVINMFFSMRNNFGGSTITQQLVKNMTQYDDVTVKRKIQEIFTALDVENTYEKEYILELYLNVIYLGDNCYGVQAAAKHYFGKDVSELTLAECASLAGITNNPSMYGPNSQFSVIRYKCSVCGEYSTKDGDVCEDCGAEHSYDDGAVWTARDYNKARQELILSEMANEDNDVVYITQAERAAAAAQPLVFRDMNDDDEDEDGAEDSGDYSWYVETVISEVLKDLQDPALGYGYSKKLAEQVLYSGGLSIYTNFDPDIQAAVDEIYTDRSNLDKTSKRGQLIKSAITIVDNSTGYVVAIAGDMGEKKGSLIWNYATDPFQPGSSFKPLSVYAPALDMGLITPATVLDDNPVTLNGKAWPRNDGRSYDGLMTVRRGLALSLNTIALRTLRLVTPEASFQFLQERFGLTTLVDYMEVRGEVKSDIAESPLAMGGLTRGVSTFEMAAAFATFPRNGAYTEPTTYLEVRNSSNQVILDNKPKTEFVLQPRTAYYMNSMLQNAVETGTGTPARISGMTVAGKTGTTNDSYARWFAGYTPYYTGVVWVGYKENEAIEGFSRNPAVVLWQKVMSIIHEDLENKSFESTVNTVNRSICLDCGNLAVDGMCNLDSRGSRVQSFTFVEGDEPAEVCTCHVPLVVCVDSPILNANGEATGRYHLAGEFCPDESCHLVYVVDYDRELATEPYAIGDYTALRSYYTDLGDPVCTVHDGTLETDPPYDPYDPSTWPSDWPGLEDPNPDSSDWPSLPSQEPGPSLPIVDPIQPVESESPAVTPPPLEELPTPNLPVVDLTPPPEIQDPEISDDPAIPAF